MSRRPNTAGPTRSRGKSIQSAGSKSMTTLNNSSESGTKKRRPQTAAQGRWGYGLGSDKAKTSRKNRFGKGVSVPTPSGSSSAGRRRQRRRRPASSNALMSRPEFDGKHMGRYQNSKPDPTYTVKYLGISRGEIGILSRQMKMSKQTRSGPLRKGPGGYIPTTHRAPKYRLDPDIVTSSLREVHLQKKNRPSTAPIARSKTVGTEDLDNGVTPCPDLYDSWKIPFTKQPRLLSGGSRPSSSIGTRHFKSSEAPSSLGTLQQHQPTGNVTQALSGQRPTTATGLRMRRKGLKQQQQYTEQRNTVSSQQESSAVGARPSTAPPRQQRQPEVTSKTAATEPPSTVELIETPEVTDGVGGGDNMATNNNISDDSGVSTKVPTSHDALLAEQLRLMKMEEQTISHRRVQEEQRREMDRERQRTFNRTSEDEAPYCVHRRIRGWKLTSPAKLWGPGPSRNWQSKQQLQLVKSEMENSSVLDVDSTGTRSVANSEKQKFGGGIRKHVPPHPLPSNRMTSERTRLMRLRREEDIKKTRARLMKGRGIRQQFLSGHSWDQGHPEIQSMVGRRQQIANGERDMYEVEEDMTSDGRSGAYYYDVNDNREIHAEQEEAAVAWGLNDEMEPFLQQLFRKK